MDASARNSDDRRYAASAWRRSGAAWRAVAARPAAGAIALLLLAAIAYIPALRGGFVWDDDKSILENPLLRTPAGLWAIWTDPSQIREEVHYWPMVYSTFWAEYQMWGARPAGYHAVNVLLHALCGLVLWALLRRLRIAGAWWAAALFALHPVHVESVAWAVERKDVLSGLLYLLSALAFFRYEEDEEEEAGEQGARRRGERHGRWRWGLLAVSLGLFALAMLSKSVACTLPCALLIGIWWKRGKIARRDWLAVAPFFAIAILLTAIDMRWVGNLNEVHIGIPLVTRCLIAGRALWFYAGTLIWPAPLLTIYPQWDVQPRDAAAWAFPAAAALALAGLWMLRGRLGRGPLAAAAYFGVTLAPMLGIIEFGYMRLSYVADRFQYLASIGLIVLAAGAAESAIARFARAREGISRRIARAAQAGILVALGILTWRQSALYRNNETLFRHTLEWNPSAWVAHLNIGKSVAERGDAEEAILHFRAALDLNPACAEAHANLGALLAGQRKFEEAIAHLERAAEMAPGLLEGRVNLGFAYEGLGKLDKAEEQYREAVRIAPDSAAAHFNLANVLSRLGRAEDALREYDRALEIAPEYGAARQNREVLVRERAGGNAPRGQ